MRCRLQKSLRVAKARKVGGNRDGRNFVEGEIAGLMPLRLNVAEIQIDHLLPTENAFSIRSARKQCSTHNVCIGTFQSFAISASEAERESAFSIFHATTYRFGNVVHR
jgi:hypothetical protein